MLYKQRLRKYSIFRSVLKRLFCVLSFAGCTYQFVRVSIEYFRYDVLSEFYRGSPMEIYQPNVSICGDLSVISAAKFFYLSLNENGVGFNRATYENLIDSSNGLMITELSSNHSHCATFVTNNQAYNCEY